MERAHPSYKEPSTPSSSSSSDDHASGDEHDDDEDDRDEAHCPLFTNTPVRIAYIM